MRRLISRRHMMRGAAAGAAGVAGLAALAACGETQVVTKEVPVETTVIKEVPVEKIVRETEIREVPVEKIVTQQVDRIVTQTVEVQKIVEVEKIVTQTVEVEKVVERVVEKVVEAAPAPMAQNLLFQTDHTSGPRGAAVDWALERFSSQFPHIGVRYVPAPTQVEIVYGAMVAAGSTPEAALMSGWFAAQWYTGDAFVNIDDFLAKQDDYNPEDWYYPGDSSGVDFADTVPYGHLGGLRGKQFGMPYQGNTNGQHINLQLMEEAGIQWPTPGNWHLEQQFLDDLRKATNPDAGTFGIEVGGGNGGSWTQWNPWGWALADDPNIMYRSADGMRTTCWDSGADRGVRLAVDLIAVHGVSPKLGESRELAGEFRDLFSAGKLLTARNGGAVGSTVGRVAGRFPWSMAPMPEGPRGPVPHEITEQPHMISNTAALRDTVEASAQFVLFMAGPEVQGRIAIDRGSMPLRKEVHASAEMAAGPPERHNMWKEYLDQPDARHRQMAYPAWLEWINSWRNVDAAHAGDLSIDDLMERSLARADRVLEDNAEAYQDLKTYIANV